ncbi:MgtC/SapB family protein [Sphingobium ummariense]
MAIILIVSAAMLVLMGYAQAAWRGGPVSGTASLAGLLTLGCGFLATSQQERLATIIAVLMTLVLALRSQLHGWIGRLSEVEVSAIVRFALISLAILPILPDRPYGPYDAWNPRQLWMVVVLVSGFSFAGYMASKRLGASRWKLATAASGAMVSSTVVWRRGCATVRKMVPFSSRGSPPPPSSCWSACWCWWGRWHRLRRLRLRGRRSNRVHTTQRPSSWKHLGVLTSKRTMTLKNRHSCT